MPRLPCLFLTSLLLCSAFAVPIAGLPSLAETKTSTQTQDAEIAKANIKAFNEAWENLRDNFYDPKFGGLDWNLVGQRYRIFADGPNADIAEIINRMLGELRASHTGYYTPD